MKHSFLRSAAVSPALKVADPAFNAQCIVEAIEGQAAAGTELLVFPELSLCGYTCGDLFLNERLLKGCLCALEAVARATAGKQMLVYVGLPLVVAGKLYNCAAAVSGGRVLGFVPKTYLPTYGEFYEARHFVSGAGLDASVRFMGEEVPVAGDLLIEDGAHPQVCVGCEICEDLWAAHSPSVEHAAHGATVIVNLSASNETIGKREYRMTLLSAHTGKNLCAYVYADAGMGESTSDMVFSGNHFIYENGALLKEALPFRGEGAVAEIDVGFLASEWRRQNTFVSKAGGRRVAARFVGEGELTLRTVSALPFVPQGKELERRCALILSMQSAALARRLEHTKAKAAVIGVSGGLDSALALLVTARAFDLIGKPREEIIAVTMPGFGTTLKTKNNSLALMHAAGVTVKSVNIGGGVMRHFKDIEHDPEVRDITYENAQARYRTMILMDLANQAGGLVIGTGDLSELALGWCTYNGDHMSMYAVNSSVPKTLVKSLVAYEAKRVGGRMEVVLGSILNTEISPELLPPDEAGNIAQKTEDIVGPYELHDFFLFHFLRRGDGPQKTFALAQRAFGEKYDRATLKKWLVNFYRRFFAQQFKRNCVPDGVKVGSVSLSPRADWRMPSDASAALWLEEAEAL